MRAARLSLVALSLGFLLTCLPNRPVAALDVPPAPTTIPIVDQTNTLTSEQQATLAQQIDAERQVSGNQIAVLMIPTLGGDALEDYSLNVARGWGIGTGENNNGVLLLIAKEDRLLRIEVGYGLEGALTDVQSSQIIRNEITPHFKEDKYFEGIQAGLTSIIAATHGEYTATASSEAAFPWEVILFPIFLGLSWLGSILARTKSWWAGGVIGGVAGGAVGFFLGSLLFGIIGVAVLTILGLFFDKVVSDNYRSHVRHGDTPSWWAGGGVLGGGKPDGGFGGFGGGGFGGGGSSGSW
jgi:uncharacterized protein